MLVRIFRLRNSSRHLPPLACAGDRWPGDASSKSPGAILFDFESVACFVVHSWCSSYAQKTLLRFKPIFCAERFFVAEI
jgi:hypothetical protein